MSERVRPPDRPQRTCVGCGKRAAQSQLLRLQFGSDGAPRLVVKAGPGRSAYMHASAQCHSGLEKKGRLLSKSLRRSVTEEQRERVLQIVQAQLRRAATLGEEKARNTA